MALAAYRHVLRSAQLAFQGDHLVLAAARKQARDTFEQNKTLQQGSEEVENGIKHAEDVARILRENIVQGEAAEKPDHYRLKIREDTERGDNDTVKFSGQKMKQKKPS